MDRFCFLHIGNDTGLAAQLVRSLREHHGDAAIVQCSDLETPEVPGISELLRFKGDTKKLMTYRLYAFSRVPITVPTWFLDTDMLCLAPLVAELALTDHDVAVCRREFNVDTPLKTNIQGLEFREFRKKTAGKMFPYIACTTLVQHPSFWRDCLKILEREDEKYHFWYGDQLAIKLAIRSGRFRFTELAETRYGCLPEWRTADALMLHIKGNRKHTAFPAPQN